MAVTVATAVQEIFSLWGIENPTASVPDAQTRAIIDLNRGVQMLWQNSEKLDYFNRQTITQTLIANTTPLALEAGIQNVLGPVRRASDLVPLNPIRTRFEADNYAQLYFGLPSLPGGPPAAYYLDRSTQPELDSLVLKLCPVPVPTINTDLLMDVILLCPSYAWSDVAAETLIPVPHAYAESLLIPILRKAAMSFHYFIVPQRAPLIEAEYALARAMLGLAAPEVDELKPAITIAPNAPWVQRRDR